MNKVLGKIQTVEFGFEEYLFGLKLTIGGDGWGCVTSIQYNPAYRDEPQRNADCVKAMKHIQELLKEAKVNTVKGLSNKPIEAEFEGNSLKNFRILTEVL